VVQSPAVRGRGLKRLLNDLVPVHCKVARCARAWVETNSAGYAEISVPLSPAVRGRGLKLPEPHLIGLQRHESPAVRGRGLKLSRRYCLCIVDLPRRPLCAGVG